MPIEGVSEEDLRQVLYDRKAVSPVEFAIAFLLYPSLPFRFLALHAQKRENTS